MGSEHVVVKIVRRGRLAMRAASLQPAGAAAMLNSAYDVAAPAA